jgi:hypothetical protein
LVLRGAEMVDPNGRVDENHLTSGLRLGGALASGALPPNAISLRALSRWMRASRPSRTKAASSLTPVQALALSRSS